MNPTAPPVNAGPIAPDFGCADQTMGLIRDLEHELDRIRHAQSGQAAEFDAMRSRWSELFDRESSLSQGFAALEERERWLAAQAGAIERRANDLAARETAFGFDRLELDRRLREIEVLDARHAASDEAVQALERELDRVRADATSERKELTLRIGMLDAERRQLAEAVASLEASLREAQAKRSAAESESAMKAEARLAERPAAVAQRSPGGAACPWKSNTESRHASTTRSKPQASSARIERISVCMAIVDREEDREEERRGDGSVPLRDASSTWTRGLVPERRENRSR
ncbi:MAG: hypothetical protein ACO396_06255, partial [Phycisphaerales bacterium]